MRFNQGYYLTLAAQIFSRAIEEYRIIKYYSIYSTNTFRSFYAYQSIVFILKYSSRLSFSYLPPFRNTTFRSLLTKGFNNW